MCRGRAALPARPRPKYLSHVTTFERCILSAIPPSRARAHSYTSARSMCSPHRACALTPATLIAGGPPLVFLPPAESGLTPRGRAARPSRSSCHRRAPPAPPPSSAHSTPAPLTRCLCAAPIHPPPSTAGVCLGKPWDFQTPPLPVATRLRHQIVPSCIRPHPMCFEAPVGGNGPEVALHSD
ncbi:MAG: hypothetical protein J3K34DRAFT_429028 [Monoraphidium minutum]|nr:MAG: hypothetical protein J3K34DRAFT_429028 [Monoraphidium minutum]